MFDFFRYHTATLSNSTIFTIYATYRSLYLVLPASARTLATVLSNPYGSITSPYTEQDLRTIQAPPLNQLGSRLVLGWRFKHLAKAAESSWLVFKRTTSPLSERKRRRL